MGIEVVNANKEKLTNVETYDKMLMLEILAHLAEGVSRGIHTAIKMIGMELCSSRCFCVRKIVEY